MCAKNANVQPYNALDATRWSPCDKKLNTDADTAPMPVAVAAAASQPSSCAIFCSSSVVVGLPKRV